MAGAICDKYKGVRYEVISKGFLMIGVGDDTPKPPNVAVNDKVLGGKVSEDELTACVLEFLNGK